MKILITGGADFIGSHLVNCLLAKDEEVVCIDNFPLGKNVIQIIGFLISGKYNRHYNRITYFLGDLLEL